MPAYEVDHSTDYLCWDDVEAGRVELNMAETGKKMLVPIAVMMRGLKPHRADGSPVNLDGQTVHWSIPQKLLNPHNEGRTITRGDVIVGDDGKRFLVTSSDHAVAKSHWYVATVLEQ